MKAIFLDLDDTLYDSKPVYEQALRRAWACHTAESAAGRGFAALEWKDFEAAYANARREVKRRVGDSTSAHSRLLYFKLLAETLHGTCAPDLVLKLDAAYSVAWELIPAEAARAVVHALAKRAPVGIITNHLCVTQLQKLSRIDPHGEDIRFVITSEEAGHEKPHPAIFAEALRRAGCRPEEAVMIGDDWTADIEGALAAGMHALYLSKKPPPAKYPPDRVRLIRQLGEAVKLL